MIRENIEISKQLRILREMWGYEESAVADYLLVTESELWDIENAGKFVVSDVQKLCDLYAVKFDDLITSGKTPIPLTMRYYSNKDLKSISYANKIFINFLEMLEISEEMKK